MGEEMARSTGWRKAIPQARDRLQSRVLVWVVGTLLAGAVLPDGFVCLCFGRAVSGICVWGAGDQPWIRGGGVGFAGCHSGGRGLRGDDLPAFGLLDGAV